FFHVDAGEPDFLPASILQVDFNKSPGTDRLLVLRDLISLGKIRVEIVFSCEGRPGGDGAVRGKPHAKGEFDQTDVENRQGTRQSRTNRADIRVRLVSELCRATAERLR